MIKKIETNQLSPGMYVHDFNCDWRNRPFFSNSIKVENEETINKIIDYGIHEIYIDTDKGMDVAGAPTEDEVKGEIEDEIIRNVAEPGNVETVPIREELQDAKKIKKEAKETVQNIMEEIRIGKSLEVEKAEQIVEKMVDSIFRNKDALTSLGRIRTMDEYTFYHSVSVGILLISFAKHLGFDYEAVKVIGVGGLLHDMGKVKVPSEILNKTDSLSDTEYRTMKDHALYSREILEETPGITKEAILVAGEHHERLDGQGYPSGLKGDEISIYGQMAAIVDVYDAITSDRCYHRAILPTEALRKIYEWSKYHFKKELVQKFIQCMGIYPVGTLVGLESGQLGVVIGNGEKSLLYPSVRIIYDTKKDRHLAMPKDIDLSLTLDDRVISYESPEKWNLKPLDYLES